jgi:5-methyltetrahydrofolate--homocysteine methyltransferase
VKTFKDVLKEKVVVFDGATGTHLQGQNLTPDDFGGEHLAGCNEYLVISKPSAVENVHHDYLVAGCDVVETNSFGGASVVLAEYDLAPRAYELNKRAAEIARRVALDFSRTGQPRFVAGSMGPTTKLPSLGHISFKELARVYEEQAAGLIDGGADLLCVETCQDVLQAKAALYGIEETFLRLKKRVPLIVSVTIESMGTMLLGTEVLAALTSIEPYDVDVLGLNCATGPKEMSEHIHALVETSPVPIFVMPNAGIPENIGGHAHYKLTPEEFAHSLTHFVRDLGVSVVGGCCGTTPAHIRQLVQSVGNDSPKKRSFTFTPSASSLYESVPFRIDNPPVLVGERTNANGSKQFRDILAKEDWDGIVAMGREQVKEQAHMLDVCAAFVGRNETADMKEIVTRFNRQITIPLVIDSTEAPVIEEALQRIGGKAVVNSINLEDGEHRIDTIVPMCRRYGAAVIALTIDEQGMAKTAEKKLEIARRIYALAVGKYGMHPHDLIFDTLTFTLGSGDEEFRRAGLETLEAIRLIKKEMPDVHTLLGVSNISFGLNPATRTVLNSVFLNDAVAAGLDMAIVHASKIIPLFKIDERGCELARQLVHDERRFEGTGSERKVLFDPLTELMALYAKVTTAAAVKDATKKLSVEEILKSRIIEGDRVGLTKDLDEALKKHTPLLIVNEILLEGMKTVGDLFGSGQMQLPFVLQSAEVMKAAVAYLEPFMEKNAGTQKGTLVLATVKGDVHDIGKNLVDIILTNNGYRVINLGIKCPVETMLHAAAEHHADAIGMSGLLVKSTLIMKENLEVMNEQGRTIPVILGGAALTRRYVEQDLRSVYRGSVHYANDAFDGLRLMQQIKTGTTEIRPQLADVGDDENSLTGMEAKIAMTVEGEFPQRSAVKTNGMIPIPPFWGTRVIDEISLDDVFAFVNETALFRGQWRITRGRRTEEEHRAIIENQIRPEFEALKTKVKSERLLHPKVVYGYFPCQSNGNDLIIYDADDWAQRSLQDIRKAKEAARFVFPRQTADRYLCISDYFASVGSGRMDVVAFHMVTMGEVASAHAKILFDANDYKEYLYFHGMGVECAEALAEMWHKHIRTELGIAHNDAPNIKKLFSQGYQGSRFSFGYPACPNLEDHKKLFALLRPERIGVTMTEEFMLHPEQSTDAIIVHHPEAKYFKV